MRVVREDVAGEVTLLEHHGAGGRCLAFAACFFISAMAARSSGKVFGSGSGADTVGLPFWVITRGWPVLQTRRRSSDAWALNSLSGTMFSARTRTRWRRS